MTREHAPHARPAAPQRAGVDLPSSKGAASRARPTPRPKRKRWSIAALGEFAAGRGGRFLSKTYDGMSEAHRWQCAAGHRFEATVFAVVHASRWCLICSGKRPHTTASMRALAKERGGTCLSKYAGIDTKLGWRCAEGHSWQTTPYLVLNGSWCPECAGVRRSPEKMLAEMRRTARERGGRCLAKRYTKAKDEYLWQCKQGHRWSRTWDQIKGGRWCPRCAGRLPPEEALADLQRIAHERGGRCLSKRYMMSRVKLDWKCARGHRWSATPGDIRSGSWCAQCAGNKPLTIDEMRQIATDRGGECLSKRIAGAYHKLRWRCREGHVWSARPANVKHGTWCPKCAAGPRYTLADMQAVAEKNGGKCVSKRFATINHHLEWQCALGHVWRAKASQVATLGTWCPVCWGRQRGTIQQMRALARERGGRCVSDEYVNGQTKLRWRCRDGHEWEMEPAAVKRGRWCRFCARKGTKGIGDFLLADHVRVARARGGACLSKRYADAQTPLRWRCQVGHEWEAPSGAIVLGTWCPECAHTRQPKLEEFRRIARDRGGECLSKRYVNARTRLRFKCSYGHRWYTLPANVRRGNWCPTCGRRRRAEASTISIEELQETAEQRGGKCLSPEYLGSREPLEWRCGLGHLWEAAPSSIRQGSWCPHCSGRAPLTIHDMQGSAANRDGKCLSKRYGGTATKLDWECKNGHRWRATPNSIRLGRWCP